MCGHLYAHIYIYRERLTVLFFCIYEYITVCTIACSWDDKNTERVNMFTNCWIMIALSQP